VALTDIADIIGNDMAMVAKVLQLVNSGFFGLAQTVTNLLEAVSYLEMDTIRNLALASDTFRVFVPDACIPISFCEEVQRHAHRTALIVGSFPLPSSLRGVCVVSALLHDIGELVLACKMPREFCAALTLAETTGCSQTEAEEQLIGTSYAEIGAYLLGLWGIDGLVVEAVAHHHRPGRITHIGCDATTSVYIADLLVHDIDLGCDTNESSLSETDKDLIDALGLSQQYFAFKARAAELFA
jgi:HD-like signal output (HDOD) protein